ncbi:MAG: hypothetical protein MZV65_24630 [Chromatiales bacterium]|nr:hypothetical protein [Chromatiales bacterium]MCK7578613.1 hypothetical protein [Chromatiales bacterium]
MLVADFLEYLKGYLRLHALATVTKPSGMNRQKAADIIGFHIVKDGEASSEDKLAIYEAKAQFSGKKPTARLQDAVDGSAKGHHQKVRRP